MVPESPQDWQPPKKRKLKGRQEEMIDNMLLQNLSHMSEVHEDGEELFGRHVAATLRRMTNHQKAIVKLRIQSILTDAEFPTHAEHCMPRYQYYQQD